MRVGAQGLHLTAAGLQVGAQASWPSAEGLRRAAAVLWVGAEATNVDVEALQGSTQPEAGVGSLWYSILQMGELLCPPGELAAPAQSWAEAAGVQVLDPMSCPQALPPLLALLRLLLLHPGCSGSFPQTCLCLGWIQEGDCPLMLLSLAEHSQAVTLRPTTATFCPSHHSYCLSLLALRPPFRNATPSTLTHLQAWLVGALVQCQASLNAAVYLQARLNAGPYPWAALVDPRVYPRGSPEAPLSAMGRAPSSGGPSPCPLPPGAPAAVYHPRSPLWCTAESCGVPGPPPAPEGHETAELKAQTPLAQPVTPKLGSVSSPLDSLVLELGSVFSLRRSLSSQLVCATCAPDSLAAPRARGPVPQQATCAQGRSRPRRPLRPGQPPPWMGAGWG